MKMEPNRCSAKFRFGYEKREESRMVPRFLTHAMEKMQLPQTEMRQGSQGKGLGKVISSTLDILYLRKQSLKQRYYSL